MKILRENRKKIHKNEQGAALLTVVVVMTVLTAMMLTMLTFVAQARYQTTRNYNNKQAYYTARSGLDTMIDYLTAAENSAAAEALIASVPPYYGVGSSNLVSDPVSIPGLGTYVITIEEDVSGAIVITSTATFGTTDNLAEQKVKAYLTIGGGGITGLFDEMLKSDSNASSALVNNATVIGDVILRPGESETLDITNESSFVGSWYNVGSLSNVGSNVEFDITDSTFVIKNGNIEAGNQIFFYTRNTDITPQNKTDYSVEYIDVRGLINMGNHELLVGVCGKNGNKNVINSGAIDVYCQGFSTTQKTVINGNLYIYASEDEESNNDGDFRATSSLTVYGDMYVEGRFTFTENLTCMGTIYVTSEAIANSILNNQKFYGRSTTSRQVTADCVQVVDDDFFDTLRTESNAVRNQLPLLKDEVSTFEYAEQGLAEQVILKGAQAINVAQNTILDYESLPNAIDLGYDYVRYQNFKVVTQSCSLSSFPSNTNMKHVNGFFGNMSTIVLIKPPEDQNLYIYLDEREVQHSIFVVDVPADSSSIVYFMLGDSDNITVNDDGSFTANSAMKATLDHAVIMTKETFEHYSDGKYLNFYAPDDLTEEEVADQLDNLVGAGNWYSPKSSCIYVVAMKDSILTLKDHCLIEGAILAPNAKLDLIEAGLQNSKLIGNDMKKYEGKMLFHIGAGIYGEVGLRNNPVLAYVRPVDNGALGGSSTIGSGSSINIIYKRN